MAEALDAPRSMRAAKYSSTAWALPIEKTLRVDLDNPLPKSAASLSKGQTLVQVRYTTLNPIDYKVAELPFNAGIPCLDFAGTVVETARSDLGLGDRVFGRTEPPTFGAAAEYVVVGRESCNKVPDLDHLSPTETDEWLKQFASLGVCGLTMHQSIVPYVKSGDQVLINGASGGTGIFGVQIAKELGCKVTAVCSATNAELVKGLGADRVIDYKSRDLVATLKSEEKVYDHIVDNIFADGAELYFSSHHYLKVGGTFVTIAGRSSLAWMSSFANSLLLPGILGGGRRKLVFVMAQTNADHYEQLGRWMRDGRIKAEFQRTYELDEIVSAFEALKSGRTKGKLAIRIGKP